MRYIISTEDTEGLIGMQISRWEKEGKLNIIEKADPVVELQEKLEKVYRSLETLKKAGYNSQVMKSFIRDQYKVSNRDIELVLKGQTDFLKQIGALK